jgi:hypothetical protein
VSILQQAPAVGLALVLCAATSLTSLASCQTHKTLEALPAGAIPTPVRRGSTQYEVDGRAVFDATFDAGERFSEGLAAVNRGCHFEGMTPCRGGKWGYIDLAGHPIVPFLYDEARAFTGGRAWVATTAGCGYIDKTGRVVVPLRFPRLGEFHDDRAMASLTVEPNVKWGYVDPSGAEVIPFRYDEARDFEHGRAIVKLGEMRGVIDTLGREVLPFLYQNVLPEVDEYAISVGGLWGLADLNGKVLVPPHYADIRPMREGFAAVRVGDKLGYVDSTDTIVIPPRFDDTGAFYEGLADVEMNGKWGYIDHTGAVVIPCRYDYARAFVDGVAEVSEAGKVAWIDRSGASVARPPRHP